MAGKALPLWVGCLLMASIAAIVTSTATSFLLVPSTNLVRDVYQRFFKPDLSDRASVILSRLAVVVLGIAAYLLIQFFRTVLEAAYAAYTVYGAALTPALMATFFWRRATVAGGVWSMASGMVSTVGWEVAKKVIGHDPWGVPAIYPALAHLHRRAGAGQPGRRASAAAEKWGPFTAQKDLSV